MDEFDLENAREQQITIEMLGDLGVRLLAEAQGCPIPLFQDGRPVAMAIEIEQFDRDWRHRDDPEPLSEEDARKLEEELIALVEQAMAGHGGS